MRSIAALMLIAAAAAQVTGFGTEPSGKEAWTYEDNQDVIDAINYDDDEENLKREVVTVDERSNAYDGKGDEDFALRDSEVTEESVVDYALEGGVDAHGWFNEVSGLPFFQSQREKIWIDATADLPELLDVCPPGAECRAESRRNLVDKLTGQWRTVIKSVQDQILGEIEVTKRDIQVTHQEFVQCQIDDHCCDTTDATIKNWWIEINNFTKQKNLLRKELEVLKWKITEVEKECPQLVTDATRLE